MEDQVAIPPAASVHGSVPVTTAVATSGSFVLSVETTVQEKFLRHLISDEELTMLDATKSEHLTDALWTLIGVFLGTLPNNVQAAYDAFVRSEPIPIGPLDLTQLVLGIESAFVAFALWKVHGRYRAKAETLVEQIRARKKQ